MVTVSRGGIPLSPDETFAWFRRARVHGPADRVEGRLSMKTWMATTRGRVAVRFEFVPERAGTRVVAHARDRPDGSLRSILSRELMREVWRLQRDLDSYLADKRRKEHLAASGA